jgi:hypothetical protein
VKDDAHCGTRDEDAPQQKEYENVLEDDHDQQEAPAPYSSLAI